MAVYSCSLFLNEFDLLDLKIAEESSMVDGIHIIESNQTYQCNEKPLYLKNNEKYNIPKLNIHFFENRMLPKNSKGETPRMQNSRLQRNSIAEFVNFEKDDVLIITDLDEINKKEDIPIIIDAAREHGLVRIMQKGYYYAINLCRNPNRAGWNGPFAVTGGYLRQNGYEIQTIRKHRKMGHPITLNGKHFSYLTNDPSKVAYKIMNASHTEYAKDRYTNLSLIRKRMKELIDPFERTSKKTHEVRKLIKVPIDETYPETILNNLDYWSQYIK